MDLKFTVLINKETRDYYNISSPYNAELVENIKKLEKKEWNGDKKVWILDPYNLYTLISFYKGRNDFFFEFVDKSEREVFVNKYKKAKEKRDKKEAAFTGIKKKQEEAIKLKETLLEQDNIDFDYSKYLNEGVVPYKYQIIGALFLNLIESGLLAFDMGLGKTIVSLLAAEMLELKGKVLVVVPNSLKFNWALEIIKFTKSKYYILATNPTELKKSNEYNIDEAKYIICNYNYFSDKNFSFKKKFESFGLDEFDLWISDESHRMKNTKSNTYKNINKFIKPIVKKTYLLSGTPMPSKIEELYVQLNIISPEEFTSKSKFYTEYCGLRYEPRSFSGWSQIETPRFEDLNKKLSGLMFRLKKKEVLKDLPDIRINKVYIEMSAEEEKNYKLIEQGFNNVDWSSDSMLKQNETQNTNPLTILMKLRQYTSSIKINRTEEMVTELNEEGEKVVIVDTFIEPLKKLNDKFSHNSELYYGDIKAQDRQTLVNRFQDPNDPLKNLLVSMLAGNVGITLTESSNMLVLTQDWVPGNNRQMWDRLHRISQKNTVNIYIFIIKDTIDEMVDKLLENKQIDISKTIDNEQFEDSSSKSVLSDILNMYKKKYN